MRALPRQAIPRSCVTRIIEVTRQVELTRPSTVHMETDGSDPACSNMIGAAGGFARCSHRHHGFPRLPNRDDPPGPVLGSQERRLDEAGGEDSGLSFQAERRSPSRAASTAPSTIVTNMEYLLAAQGIPSGARIDRWMGALSRSTDRRVAVGGRRAPEAGPADPRN
jgi:hypothetical protein